MKNYFISRKGKHHLKSKKDSEKGNMKVIYGAKFKFIKRKNIGCWIPFQNGQELLTGGQESLTRWY